MPAVRVQGVDVEPPGGDIWALHPDDIHYIAETRGIGVEVRDIAVVLRRDSRIRNSGLALGVDVHEVRGRARVVDVHDLAVEVPDEDAREVYLRGVDVDLAGDGGGRGEGVGVEGLEGVFEPGGVGGEGEYWGGLSGWRAAAKPVVGEAGVGGVVHGPVADVELDPEVGLAESGELGGGFGG